MRLLEIELIQDLPDHLHDNVRAQQWREEVSDGVEVGQMGGYQIVRTVVFTGTAYFAVKDGEPVGRILTSPFDGDLENSVVVPHVWVIVEARRQGIALILYSHLILSGLTVVSDYEQTQKGKAVWAKLAQVFDVRTYNNEKVGPKGDLEAYEKIFQRLIASREGVLDEVE